MGVELQDRFVTVEGLRIRYLDLGEGPAVLFLHGASLGSSADVFVDNLAQFAKAGFRALAFDTPGFGLSDVPAAQTLESQRNIIPKFIDAIGLKKVALVAHSRAGGFAVQLALGDPKRYSHLVILGTGSLLPPQDEEQLSRHAAVQSRVDRDMAAKEPTKEDVRKLLEADLYDKALVTDERLALRHSRSVGKNFLAHVARQEVEGPRSAQTGMAMHQRLSQLRMPLLMIYGREDRAHAAERAALLKHLHPSMNIHIVDRCKHLVPWDAADAILRLVAPFLKLGAMEPAQDVRTVG
jgi:pimeloyl-ACP methyl ester carboxylesterase